ncbi:MAG: hypothetical protein ABSG83_07865 [Roseiarcus sp.]|jgi:hypothetical protein
MAEANEEGVWAGRRAGLPRRRRQAAGSGLIGLLAGAPASARGELLAPGRGPITGRAK